MTTKDQERQAIEEIRKIVEGLGENSYVGRSGASRGEHQRRHCVQHETLRRDRTGTNGRAEGRDQDAKEKK